MVDRGFEASGSVDDGLLGSAPEIDSHKATGIRERVLPIEFRRSLIAERPSSADPCPRPSEAVGESEQQSTPDVVGRHVPSGDGTAPGQVAGSSTNLLDGSTVGVRVMAVPVENQGESFSHVGRQVGWSTPQDITVLEECGKEACQPRIAGVDDHTGEAGMKGKIRHGQTALRWETGSV
jgi:hypothetical protein